MPIQHAIWRIGDPPVQLVVARLFSEQQLEDMIVAGPGMLSASGCSLGGKRSQVRVVGWIS